MYFQLTRFAYFERLKTMRNEVHKNYLTPKPYAKLVKSLLHRLRIPSYHCCNDHGDSNVKTYRLVKFLNVNN